MHYEARAAEVVRGFKRMLTDEALAEISDEHFSELETLIAAALGTVNSQTKHKFAKQLEAMAHEVRQSASSSD